MIKVRQTAEFSHWLRRLEDDNAAGRILVRIRRAELGNLGDCRSVGGGVMEMRVDLVRATELFCTAGRGHRCAVVWR